MGNLAKWNTEETKGKPIHGVLFVSRTKDNNDVEGFEQRRINFLTVKSPEELALEFDAFVQNGVEGEMSRFYYSVNSRSNKKTKRAFLRWMTDAMLDGEDFSVAALDSKVAQIAMKPENRETSKWLLDFDEDALKLNEFLDDARKASVKHGGPEVELTAWKTPNGYGVECSHGFDSSEFCEKWGHNVIKKDDLLCADWKTK